MLKPIMRLWVKSNLVIVPRTKSNINWGQPDNIIQRWRVIPMDYRMFDIDHVMFNSMDDKIREEIMSIIESGSHNE